jgi:hypothetical protein
MPNAAADPSNPPAPTNFRLVSPVVFRPGCGVSGAPGCMEEVSFVSQVDRCPGSIAVVGDQPSAISLQLSAFGFLIADSLRLIAYGLRLIADL